MNKKCSVSVIEHIYLICNAVDTDNGVWCLSVSHPGDLWFTDCIDEKLSVNVILNHEEKLKKQNTLKFAEFIMKVDVKCFACNK